MAQLCKHPKNRTKFTNLKDLNPTPRQWVDCSNDFYTQHEIKACKSHPRQWVDHSDDVYTQHESRPCNPTHGSGWIVSDPFYNTAPELNVIPPTAVGGSFR
jgi:hypothetical protein